MAKLLYDIVGPTELSEIHDNLWSGLEVHEPIVNTLTITTEQGEQFLVNVKKVSR